MQPTEDRKKSTTNSTNSTVRERDQPDRQSRSANSTETSPVSTSAAEKNRNSRQPLRMRGTEAGTMWG